MDASQNTSIFQQKDFPVCRLLTCCNIGLTQYIFLNQDCKELRAYEKSNRFILRNKGELAPDRSEKAENMSTQFQRLLNNTLQFAEVLDEEMPNLPEEGKLALNLQWESNY